MLKRSATRGGRGSAVKHQGGMAAAGVVGLLAVVAVTSAGSASAGPAAGKFACQPTAKYGAFAPISAGPNSYIIGNCSPGTELLRTYHSHDRKGSDGGFIAGSFNGCGAVQTRNLHRVNSTQRIEFCTQPGKRSPSEFLSVVDCRAHGKRCRTWDRDLGGDKTTRVVGTCQAYANYRPFSSTPMATDPVQVITPANRKATKVRWRYITKNVFEKRV